MSSSSAPEDDRLLRALNRIRPRSLVPHALDFLEDYYRSHDPGLEAARFKLMYEQANLIGLCPAELSERSYLIIHWIRRNPLKILISLTRKNVSGIAHTTKGMDQIKIKLDTRRLIRDLSYISNSVRFFRGLLGTEPHLEMYYEDFAGKEDSEIGRVLDYLGVSRYATLSCDLKKITSENLEEVLSNYGEVQRTLEDTRFEKYLY